MAEWYYAVGNAQHGPVSADQIANLVRARTIDGNTLVWSASMTDWQPLSRTELASALGAPPPGGGFSPSAGGPFGAPQGQPGTAAGYGAPGYGAPAYAGAPPVATFGEAVRAFWRNYAVFQGRATRPEFWYAVLFMFLLGTAAGLLDLAIVGQGSTIQPVSSLASLAMLIPSISVAVRRLHDTDRSGWLYLLIFLPLIGFIVLIVFWCQRGTPGPNRFG